MSETLIIRQPPPANLVVVDDADSNVEVTEESSNIEITDGTTETTVVRDSPAPHVVEQTTVERVVVATQGTLGPVGPPGADSTVPGPQGIPGVAGSAPQAYTHVQNSPASIWNITHNLGYFPNITAFDSGGTESVGEIEQIDINSLRLHFSSAFSGTAYLS